MRGYPIARRWASASACTTRSRRSRAERARPVRLRRTQRAAQHATVQRRQTTQDATMQGVIFGQAYSHASAVRSTDRVAFSDKEAPHAMQCATWSAAALPLHLPCASRARPPSEVPSHRSKRRSYERAREWVQRVRMRVYSLCRSVCGGERWSGDGPCLPALRILGAPPRVVP